MFMLMARFAYVALMLRSSCMARNVRAVLETLRCVTARSPTYDAALANFVRRAKSGSDWSSNELPAYNVTIVERDEQQFFSGPLPPYTGPAGFVQYEGRVRGINKESLALIKRLNLVMKTGEGEESAVGDFATEVLRALGYETEQTVIRTRKALRLNVDSHILLLVQQDKSHISLTDSEAQLVAQAIAAFQTNNVNRHANLFLSLLQSYVFPGITVIGTFPCFYKIKVTHDLNLAVRTGQYPAVETVVERYTPRVPSHLNDGMRPLDNRLKILQCYEAFKQIVYWQEAYLLWTNPKIILSRMPFPTLEFSL
ncbi:hypothetical protein M422DRAFT_254106 [Sphaerobolus stellatus SS14]|uniref:Uncharacterized protein n=1 Tax=Sphaerobolus stellatus (strain SS14) TaxID=990650 RepID=A0A0C9VVI5_SPHS4|nr:hypothetical protein M422DRAFT_254106 [Sphaerobolus stellatus SS14]